MAEVTCEKCGETFGDTALTCWACGTLTAAGRKARGGAAPDDEEAWRQSVEAARARQGQAAAVDPDAALKQVLAQTGTEEPRPHAAKKKTPVLEARTDYTALREAASTTNTLGLLLAVLFALAGMLLVVVAILSQAGPLASIAGVAALLLFGALAITVNHAFRSLATVMTTAADAAESARRAVAMLRDHLESPTEKRS